MRSEEPLKAVFSFREYQYYWPERLAVDYALAAERHGAVIMNHTAIEKLARQDNDAWQLTLRGKGENFTSSCNARLVINTTGAWADNVAGLPGQKVKKRIAATKGTFLVVKLPEDYAGHSIATFDRSGYPFYSLAAPGYHVIGPTEWANDQQLDNPVSRTEDIETILDNFNTLFPGLYLSPADLCYCWTGIRPMPYRPEVKGKQNLIPELHDHGSEGMPGFLTLSGGPLMVHRITARSICDKVKKRLRPGSGDIARDGKESVARGLRCIDVEEVMTLEPDTLRQMLRDEHVATLSDLLFRRIGTGWDPGMCLSEAPRIAQALGQALGWSLDQIETELAIYQREIQEFECPTSQN
jgi:glycerol-3-phosphate dehydrogenase